MNNYQKGFEKGYRLGLKKAHDTVNKKFYDSIEFAGALRMKQYKLIQQDLNHTIHSIKNPEPTCGFSAAYQGECKSTEITENGQCANHQHKCCQCGELATQSCAHSSQFVCGAPLCERCTHKH